ncbi:MAG: OmpA family protein [Sphingobacteriales bacterium]|nr:OmpA family protein [Sphingobacteriales bacterium]
MDGKPVTEFGSIGDDSKGNNYFPDGFVLNHIYYDFDQDVIREDAKPELDKVVKLMYENPGLQIELRSHTDSRGTDEYNTALAERRAKSAYDFIVSRGGANVNVANDVRPKGYGETQPVNECVDGVPCANAKHQENRRTEFVVIGYNANGAIRSAPRYYYRDDYHQGKNYYKKGSGSNSSSSSSVPTSTYKPSGSASMSSTPSSSAKTQTAAPSVDTSNQFTPKGGNAPTYYDKAAAESTNTGTGVGMEYKIHIGSFRSPDLSKFNVLTDVGTIETEPTESGSQRVILGTFKDKESADAMLSKVKKEGFGEAYVITYQDGLRVGR